MGMMTMVKKTTPGWHLGMDAETGVIEAYVSIMGILDSDQMPDKILMGAFRKSLEERGPAGARKIRVLWQHNWDEVIGMPLVLVEHGRESLPAEVLAQYPTATGGLFAKTQLILDVQRGREAYALYKAGAMSEWSIGFDILQAKSMREQAADVVYREISEIRLWEYSPVTWGANPATVTVGVKSEGIAQEGDQPFAPMGTGDGLPAGNPNRAEPLRRALTQAKIEWLKNELRSKGHD